MDKVRFMIRNPLIILAALCTIMALILWAYISNKDSSTEMDIAIAGIYLLSSMLLWILAELVQLNIHFSKMEEKDDQQDP